MSEQKNLKPFLIKTGTVSISEDSLKEQQKNSLPIVTKAISLELAETSGEDNKWYIPRLNINDPAMWESQPPDKRKHFTDDVAFNTCLGNCCGVSGLKSVCCHLDPDDLEHVLGPLEEKWIKETIDWLRKQGIKAARSDIVIDFEEGQIIGEKFFNGHQVFKSKTSYPMMRFQINGPRFACKWLNPHNGKCTIYPRRPSMCSGYLCEFIKKNFFVKTKDKPNTWQILK